MRGGGAFSGRMTAPLCAAGGVCLQILKRRNINISAHILLIGDISDTPYDPMRGVAEVCGEFPCVSPEAAEHMKRSILCCGGGGRLAGSRHRVRAADGVPAGLGGPLFEGLEGRIASLVFAIPAVKGMGIRCGL